MLNTLSIRNVVLIDKLDLEFDPGFLALTGETGAGKSILLDSLCLALGRRSDVGLVGKAADKASVTAAFDVAENHPVFDVLRDAEFENDGLEIILRRTVDAKGRSKAYLNDQPVTAGLLRRIGDALVEVHGQFDQYGLMDSKTHLDILDRYAGVFEKRKILKDKFDAWKTLQKKVADILKSLEDAKQEEEFFRHALQDMEALDPQEGEETQLVERRAMLSHANKILEGVNTISGEISGDKAIEERLYKISKIFDRLGDALGDRAGEYETLIGAVSETLDELKAKLEDLAAEVSEESASFESLDDRLFAIRALARKYQCHPDALPELLAEYREKLSMIDDVSNIDALKAEEDAAKNAYKAAAEELHKLRVAAAVTMKEKIEAELKPLKLENVRFQVAFDVLEMDAWRVTGMDKIGFEVSTNPGQPFGPLSKVASGGELSRLMLALKVVLHENTASKTLIFDEVDSGIGGPTADAVGKRLKRLGEGYQVLTVTHSPQVAACGARHYHVSKAKDGERMKTMIRDLDQDMRIEELSRMLSGENITDEARSAARKLVANG